MPPAPKPPPPPDGGAETVGTARGRSRSARATTSSSVKTRIAGKTTPAAAEKEEAKEAPPAKKSKDGETAQTQLKAPSNVKKPDLTETVMRVSKLPGFDEKDAARIQELAAQVEGADNKTLKRIQVELLAIYNRSYRVVKAASAEASTAEASTASGSRVKAGKEKQHQKTMK